MPTSTLTDQALPQLLDLLGQLLHQGQVRGLGQFLLEVLQTQKIYEQRGGARGGGGGPGTSPLTRISSSLRPSVLLRDANMAA